MAGFDRERETLGVTAHPVTDSFPRHQSEQTANDLDATWRSYLPEHVLHLLRTAQSVSNPPVTQRTEAVVLFADVVGFTAMTESFGSSGSYGTEQLTRVINQWFAVTADAIAGSGGSVVDFAGDALVGMFTYTTETAGAVAGRALRCAQLIREATASVGPVSTPDGPHTLTIRMGLARGPLLVMLLGDPAIRLQHVVAGPALDGAVEALHRADRGEIIVDPLLSAAALGPDEKVCPRRSLPGDGLEDLLTPFLHPAIRARLSSGRHELVNEHRKVSTAFVRLADLDIEDPASVLALQRCLAAAVAVIDRYGGHLRHVMADDKGTVLVAVFGTPVSNEDDEERALRCGLELLALPGGPYSGGVTTGPVYCGEVGSDVRREYAVVGDPVNLAARLMSAAEPGTLLVDEATYERGRDVVVAEGPSLLAAKGKTEPVAVWGVREVHDAAPAAPLPSPAPGLLVGRTGELDLLRSVARRAATGHGQVVWLHGEAGIGKSRLAAEICSFTSRLGFTGFAGSCRSHGTRAGYLVWRSIWRELLGINSARPVEEQRATLTGRIARYDGSGERAPVLAAVVNLPMPETELTAQLDPVGRDELLRATLLACLRDRVAEGPLVLLLEDCHWIDPASMALLEHLAGQIADLPVLMIATSREPMPEGLAGRPQVADLTLSEMGRSDTDRLTTLRFVERYGPDTTVAPQVVREIAAQAGGNAFYIEELVSYLHGHGVDPGDPAALDAVHVPDSLQRLVMARIDQLTDDEQSTIKVASVIGRQFRSPWIATVYPPAGSADEVAGHLVRLRERDLTRPTEEPEHEFRHPITQETAYQSLTYETRAELHERIGRLVEETFRERLGQYVDVLAHHYGRTSDVAKQRIWFRAAGDRAKRMFTNETATHYYGRLLPLLSEAERAELHIEIGTVHQHTGQWAAAADHYRKAIRAAAATGREDILAAGRRQLGDLLMYTHSDAQAIGLLTRALEGFERLRDTAGLSRTMDRMTFAFYRQGAYDEALAMAQRHLAMATRAGDLSAMSIALNHLGLVALSTGRWDDGLVHLRRSLSTAEQAGDRQGMLHAACNLGWAHRRREDNRPAIRSYRHALTVARDIGARQSAAVVVGNMTEIYRDEGHLRQARVCGLHSLNVAIELRDWSTVADQVAQLGTLAAREGRPEEARRLLERAVDLARELAAPSFLCDWLHRLARVHRRLNDPVAAERSNTEAMRLAEEHEERGVQVQAFVLSVRLAAETGRLAPWDAAARLREGCDRWDEPHEKAVLLAAAWRVHPADEGARSAAAALYRAAHDSTPNAGYRLAYQRLTGEELPVGPPLPELPEWLTAETGPGLETLLGRIDRSPRRTKRV